jgi:D-alanyl-D-alanine carboxypeptidase
MKTKLLLLAFVLTTTQAYAGVDSYEASFEDTEEFLAPETDAAITPNETWAYVFELVRANGTTKVLSTQNKDVMLKPASTMKLFTGWWAFQKGNRTDAYLSQMLHKSDNNMAEATVQRLGGVLAMEDYYRDNGLALDNTNFTAADGSGLSYENKATCEIEMQLLKSIKASKSYTRFKKLLAQPNQTGTLKTRLTAYAGRLYAKTGTLNKTASLSGFLETKKGTVVFCVLSDYLNTSVTTARKKIDAMVKKNYALAK